MEQESSPVSRFNQQALTQAVFAALTATRLSSEQLQGLLAFNSGFTELAEVYFFAHETHHFTLGAFMANDMAGFRKEFREQCAVRLLALEEAGEKLDNYRIARLVECCRSFTEAVRDQIGLLAVVAINDGRVRYYFQEHNLLHIWSYCPAARPGLLKVFANLGNFHFQYYLVLHGDPAQQEVAMQFLEQAANRDASYLASIIQKSPAFAERAWNALRDSGKQITGLGDATLPASIRNDYHTTLIRRSRSVGQLLNYYKEWPECREQIYQRLTVDQAELNTVEIGAVQPYLAAAETFPELATYCYEAALKCASLDQIDWKRFPDFTQFLAASSAIEAWLGAAAYPPSTEALSALIKQFPGRLVEIFAAIAARRDRTGFTLQCRLLDVDLPTPIDQRPLYDAIDYNLQSLALVVEDAPTLASLATSRQHAGLALTQLLTLSSGKGLLKALSAFYVVGTSTERERIITRITSDKKLLTSFFKHFPRHHEQWV